MESIIQAYSNTPRRKQLTVLGGFFLCLLVLAVLLISYLIVSSHVVSVGRDLQNKKNEIDKLEYGNVSLRGKIASLTTLAEIERQASEQGFRPATPDEVLFVVVSGYTRSIQIPTNSHEEPQNSALQAALDVNRPAYHKTLLEWLGQELVVFSDIFEGYEP
ncbi:MAG: Cell division protein FtsL [Chloroflexi bacterium]|nr:Cell division protein FtsL [Chloroflexota bacterium]